MTVVMPNAADIAAAQDLPAARRQARNRHWLADEVAVQRRLRHVAAASSSDALLCV
jgi:hypothetical protein